jgi:hypothetical protein
VRPDFPRRISGFSRRSLAYNSGRIGSGISSAQQRRSPMRSYLIAAGLASSLITVWIALVQVIA